MPPANRDDMTAGRTVPELAAYLRVGQEKIRSWIRRGELQALNVADAMCGRPRFVITPDALAEFEKRRTAGPPPRAPRRKRRTLAHDYYAD